MRPMLLSGRFGPKAKMATVADAWRDQVDADPRGPLTQRCGCADVGAYYRDP